MRRFASIVARLGKIYIHLSIPIQGFKIFSRNMLQQWAFLLQV